MALARLLSPCRSVARRRSGSLGGSLVNPSYRTPRLLRHFRASSGGVSYPLQLSSVSENHAALYEESLQHPEQFWGDLARRRLRWTKEFDQVMDCDMHAGSIRWFDGGKINVAGLLSK